MPQPKGPHQRFVSFEFHDETFSHGEALAARGIEFTQVVLPDGRVLTIPIKQADAMVCFPGSHAR